MLSKVNARGTGNENGINDSSNSSSTLPLLSAGSGLTDGVEDEGGGGGGCWIVCGSESTCNRADYR